MKKYLRRTLLLSLPVVCAGALTALCAAALAAASPIARTDAGLVRGTPEGGLSIYRGIPFAAPPVGKLRWRPPEPAPKWSGVRAADHFAASCMQQPPAELREAGAQALSEDCLYLNVWTPARSGHDSLPVMVWIYGGGFNQGSTAIPLYSGEQLARHGVVVVSMAYRVGPFGFLAHPALSADSPHHVSGNFGLLDQIAGLRWVRRNIAAFGGDPHRVTIFGESAGGISVSILAASPLAKGLFDGAISESGGSFGPTRTPPEPGENLQTLADAERDGAAFAAKLGAGTASDLRQLPAQAVQSAAAGHGLFWPTLDGWVIPGDQYELYQAGRYNDTPILIGTNSDEGALFGAPKRREAYVAAVHARYGPFAERLLELYPASKTGWRQSSMDLTRDAAFGWHNWVWARLQAMTGTAKVFLYYFAHIPPRAAQSPWKNATGAVHSEEMVYVFQHLNQRALPWTAEDRAMSDAMATYWTNFAKRGDPNGPGVPAWPAFGGNRPAVMRFTDAPRAGALPNAKKLEALDAYFAWRRTPAGAKWPSARQEAQ
jgi:para-nitrobenzyl esterase